MLRRFLACVGLARGRDTPVAGDSQSVRWDASDGMDESRLNYLAELGRTVGERLPDDRLQARLDRGERLLAADNVTDSAIEDAVRAMAPRLNAFVADNEGKAGMLAHLVLMRLGKEGTLPEDLGPLPSQDECSRRVEALLEDFMYEGLLAEGEAQTRHRLVEHYSSSFRFGVAMLLGRVVVGVWPDDAPTDDMYASARSSAAAKESSSRLR